MPANSDPIYSRAPQIERNDTAPYMSAVNTTADLTSGTNYLLFTADATNGGYVQKIRFRATPAGNTTATVVRIWINNGSTTATALNNMLFDELSLPATTATAVAATANYEMPLNFALPAGYKLYATLGTGSANGWVATVIGGKY